ncbi:MAG: hypothetical protein KDB53_12040, partial [Planctomycetes bacterium]|nr:hypothetical protein [Planctomycetota bacterium]
ALQVSSPGGVGLIEPVTIDANGSARFAGLYPGRCQVKIGAADQPYFIGENLGSADLTEPGSKRLDFVVENSRSCVFQVTVDGEPRLPETYSIHLGQAAIDPIEEDPDRGRLSFKFRPRLNANSVSLRASALGCPPLSLELSLKPEDGPITQTLAFETGSTVQLRVLPPTDNKHDVSLEFLDPERSIWSSAGRRALFGSSAPVGERPVEMTFDSLRPGRYRARDTLTGIVSETKDVLQGSTSSLEIDLSKAGDLTVIVTGPTDQEYASAQVLLDAEGLVNPGDRRTAEDGVWAPLGREVTLRVPGDRPATVHATHRLLVPDAEAGRAEVLAFGSKLELKLVKGNECQFRVAPDSQPFLKNSHQVKVLLFKDDLTGDPVASYDAEYGDGLVRFAGFSPGRYHLWCDTERAAPLILRDVDFRPGVTDLGELTLSPGASVHGEILPKAGQDPPRYWLTATSVEPPIYRRQGYGRGAEITIRGLGPGRFTLTPAASETDKGARPHDIESTGEGQIEVKIDLRD